MAILITSPATGGRIRTCNSSCHNAQLDICVCVCRGINHGLGPVQAAINTHDHFDQIINAEAPEDNVSSFQLSLDNLIRGEKN